MRLFHTKYYYCTFQHMYRFLDLVLPRESKFIRNWCYNVLYVRLDFSKYWVTYFISFSKGTKDGTLVWTKPFLKKVQFLLLLFLFVIFYISFYTFLCFVDVNLCIEDYFIHGAFEDIKAYYHITNKTVNMFDWPLNQGSRTRT